MQAKKTTGAAGQLESKDARSRCIRKFLRYFKNGFSDQKYIDWERQYKWDAHIQFQQLLNKAGYRKLLRAKKYNEIAQAAIRIESRTNLLFSFEKMAIRDAVKSEYGARVFAQSLYEYIYGEGSLKYRFENFITSLTQLPRKQTRVLTWPLVTVFGFIADPVKNIFLKPRVTQIAAEKYKFKFIYNSTPNWTTYQSLLAFSEQIRTDTAKYHPADFIDLQSFIWVMGSEEYPD